MTVGIVDACIHDVRELALVWPCRSRLCNASLMHSEICYIARLDANNHGKAYYFIIVNGG